MEDLDKVRKVELSEDNDIKARDLFLFQCNTGISYIDTQEFDTANVRKVNGRLGYNNMRVKTTEPFYIPLNKEANVILDRYGGTPPKLPPRTYNTHIGIVGKNAGLNVRLTSHWARHTFAMICMNNGMSILTLSKILGHSKTTTTEIYAKLRQSTIDEEFDNVMRKIQGKQQ